MHSRAIYTSLSFLFLFLTVGPKALLVLFLVVVLFIFGFILFLIRDGLKKRRDLMLSHSAWARSFRFSQGLVFARDSNRFSDSSIYAEKHSMTNSELLDPILEQILDNLMRDFVDSWYFAQLSDDKLFRASLKRTARRTLIALRTCLSKVDWVPLLTRHFVDDFASHLRLYRKAKERLQFQKESAVHRKDDLESAFFDLELEMERSYCRDLVSTSPAYESAYLHDICDILLYLLMPSEDFRSRPLRFLVREVFVTKVFIPLLDKLSDSCFVNRMIVWLLSELPISTEDFVASLEAGTSVQELEAILESVHEEMNSLRSKGGGLKKENGNIFSQQLASLDFTETVIKRRMYVLANRPDSSIHQQSDDQNMFSSKGSFDGKLIGLELAEDASSLDLTNSINLHLPITVVLTHPVALSHFVEFLNKVGGQNYIDFYLAIEGFKVSMDHQLRGLASGETLDADAKETIREAALFMYHQYLSQEAITRVPLNESVINRFLARLRNDEPSDMWFEQIQNKIVEVLQGEERFYPSFKNNRLYEKMLDELGIGPTPTTSSIGDEEEEEHNSSTSWDGIEEVDLASVFDQSNVTATSIGTSGTAVGTTVQVEMLGVGHQGSRLFALYNVRVMRAGCSSNVIRRYSDFHSLHNLIVAKFPTLRTLSFPGKKTFNNLDQDFLERRCKALNQYMNCILQPSLLNATPGLEPLVFNFLTQKRYTGRESFSNAMSTMVFNPLVSGVKAFGNAAVAMPSELIDGIGKMGTELNRAATNVLKGGAGRQQVGLPRAHSTCATTGALTDPSSRRVAAHLDDNDSSEPTEIPIRVLLLLIDEVFGLRAKNQWFRRRLVSLLRQFVHAALGQSINRRIIDAVNWLTSEEQVASYLIAFRDAFWTESGATGAFSEQGLQLDSQKTRLLARYLMLSAVPDELRLFIGGTTIQHGVDNMSEALQNRHLNRRLWYVILERVLSTTFPNNRFDRLLPQLHSKSPRTRIF